MGIYIEFNPDLALRNKEEHLLGKRKEEECIPEPLEVGGTYPFLKEGQRCYWLEGEIPLLMTKGGGDLSKPLASIIILEATHVKEGSKTWTKGFYKVVAIIPEGAIYFNGMNKI